MADERNLLNAFDSGIDAHWLTMTREMGRAGSNPDLVRSTATKLLGYKPKNYGEALDAIFEAGPGKCADIDPRWKELRKTLFSEESIQARMTEQTSYLQQNGIYQRESARWEESPASADLTKTFEFVHARLAFLDEYFAELTK